MPDPRPREPMSHPPADTVPQVERLAAEGVTAQQCEPGRTNQEDSEARLQSLQEWICELLIQNQQLRMSLLESAIDRKAKERSI